MRELTTSTRHTEEINLPSSLHSDRQPTDRGVSSMLPSPRGTGAPGDSQGTDRGGHGEHSGGLTHGALDSSIIKDDPLELIPPNFIRKRKTAYFNLMSGSRCHDRLCHLILGIQRGSSKNYDNALKRLMRFIYRYTGHKPEYHQTKVWDQKDGIPRIHGHLLINMPFIPQYILLAEWQKYLGEQASLFIKFIPDDERRQKAIGYVMHYNLKQRGIPKYSQSHGWMPRGAHKQWKTMKRDIKRNDPNILKSDSWRAAMIQCYHEWLDEQRRQGEQHALH